MRITIRMLQGKPIDLDVAETATVTDVKVQIAKEVGIDVESQKLIISGKVLSEPNKLLTEYSIKDHDFLVLMASKVFPMSTSRANRPTRRPLPLQPLCRLQWDLPWSLVSAALSLPLLYNHQRRPALPSPRHLQAPSPSRSKPLRAQQRGRRRPQKRPWSLGPLMRAL